MTHGPPSERSDEGPRWQYVVMWRPGPLLLTAVGLAMLGFGASVLRPTAISVTMLPLEFLLLIAGVTLDWGDASDDLLAILASWGVQPVASGEYPAPAQVSPEYAKRTWGGT